MKAIEVFGGFFGEYFTSYLKPFLIYFAGNQKKILVKNECSHNGCDVALAYPNNATANAWSNQS